MLTSIRRSLRQQKGFTFMELVIVIAIIGILAAIAVPNLLSTTDGARGSKIVGDLRTIDSAIAMAIAQGKTVTEGDLPASVTANLASTPKPPTGKAVGPANAPRDVTATKYEVVAVTGQGFRAAITVGTDKLTADTF